MQIIVAQEKHETRYLDASTPETWAKSSLALLTQRFRAGYWYYDPTTAQDEYSLKARAERAGLLATTEEQLASLPASVAVDLQQKRIQARRDEALDLRQHNAYEAIRKVVESQCLDLTPGRRATPVAWILLEARSDYEYEGVSMETLEAAPEPQAPTIEPIDIDTVL